MVSCSSLSRRANEEEEMTGEEVAGPPGPKVLRLLYFVGAGFICVVAINKWKQLERKSIEQRQQDKIVFSESSAAAVHKGAE